MKKIFKMLGLSLVIVTVLVLALGGSVSAAGNNPGIGTQNQGEVCLCGECPCGDCVCDGCQPNQYLNFYNHSGPGNWKAQTGK